MPEAMAAVLLFSMLALSLLNYLQALRHGQEGLHQYREALVLGHQALELYRLGARDRLPAPPRGWLLHWLEQPRGSDCRQVTAEVRIPSGRCVRLSEWFCRSGGGDAVAPDRQAMTACVQRQSR